MSVVKQQQQDAELTDQDNVSPLNVDIDLDAQGKHTGRISVPYSRDDSAWGSILIPITSIKNGKGPTILLTGGNHGDEYEGQISLIDLARNLSADDVAGHILILPHMNYPAVVAGTRTSPIDAGNMNRIYPGRADGTVSEKIAHFVTHELIERADAVLDMHSGGKTLDFVPSAIMHKLDDREMMEKTLAALKAFGAPVSMILGEDTTGMLDGTVESRKKIFVSTELGGLGMVTAERMAITRRGVMNFLRHFGAIKGKVEDLDTRFMDTPPGTSSILSLDEGMLEPLVDLGDTVEKGDPIAKIWFYQDPEREPKTYTAPQSGMMYARHAPGLVKRGDSIAYVGIDYDVSTFNL